MLRRALFAAMLASVFSVALTGAKAQQIQGVTETEIVLGSIQDISGPVASVGGPMRDGMTMAVEDINAAGGINGRRIRLVVEDSGYDPKKGVLAAQKLLTQDKVFAMVATLGSAVTQATQPLALDRNVPYLFPLAASDITFLPYHPLKFGLYALASEHMRTAVEYAYTKLGKRRFGVLYQDDETGQQNFLAAEEQLKVHGLRMIEVTTYKRGETNFSAQISRLKAANLDVLVLGTIVRETAAAAIEAKAQGWPVDMIVNQGLVGAVIALGGKSVDGLYGTTQYLNSAEPLTPEYKAFTERFKARFGRDVGDGVNYGYVCLMLFAEGAKNAGRALTPQTLAQGLEKVRNFKSLFQTAPISFGPNDHAPPRGAYVLQVKEGKWTVLEGPISY
jgi:ABC-type branched-subunit amino acid transport system substrate-binding protein